MVTKVNNKVLFSSCEEEGSVGWRLGVFGRVSSRHSRTGAMSQPPTPRVIHDALTPAQLASLRVGGAGWDGPVVGLPETRGWRLGLVVGGLGSGKSSLARVAHQAFRVEPQPTEPLRWAPDKAVVSGIGASPDASVAALQSCGLSAVPALLRPFSSLSGGERTKSELALRVHAHHTVFDDFGATVSRDAASSAAAGVAKLLAKSDVVKRTLRRVVFTSFPEVGGYLGADWVLCLETNTLVIRGGAGPALGPTIVIDDSELEITTAPPERQSEGNDVKELKTSVRVDEWVKKASEALATPFDGTSVTCVHRLPWSIIERVKYPPDDEREATGGETPLRILLVSGRSGSGKTAACADAFGPPGEWANAAKGRGVESIDVRVARFQALGFDEFVIRGQYGRTARQLCEADPSEMSTSEAYLVSLADSIRTGAVLDEFLTSLPPATRAKVAKRVGEYARHERIQGLVLLSCHGEEIARDLQPDVMFSAETGVEVDVESIDPVTIQSDAAAWPPEDLIRRPTIRLTRHKIAGGEGVKAVKEAWWAEFSPNHYLGGASFNAKGCQAWVFFIGERAVAFDSTLPMPGKSVQTVRQHRLVVMPDFQGLGIGSAVTRHDAAKIITTRRAKTDVYDDPFTQRYMSSTYHTKLGKSRDASPLWRGSNLNGKPKNMADTSKSITAGLNVLQKAKGKAIASIDRQKSSSAVKERKAIVYSHEYLGTDAERRLFLAGCGERCEEQSEKENRNFLSIRKIKGGPPAPAPVKRQMTLGFAVAPKKPRQ